MDTIFHCAGCGERIVASSSSASAVCPKCGRIIVMNTSDATANPSSAFTTMPVKRYHVLRFLVVLLKVIAALLGVAAVLAPLIIITVANQQPDGTLRNLYLFQALIWPVALAMGAVFYWAGAESIMVFIDIEENTRAIRQMTERQG